MDFLTSLFLSLFLPPHFYIFSSIPFSANIETKGLNAKMLVVNVTSKTEKLYYVGKSVHIKFYLEMVASWIS